jgi:hypothetical protein
MNINGSVAFVTGANRGLGKAFVDSCWLPGSQESMQHRVQRQRAMMHALSQ